jgi:hypothetical protein
MNDPKCYVTPNCTMVYPELFQPVAFGNQEPKYSAQFLIAKSNDVTPMREAVKAAAAAKFGTQILNNMGSLHFPVRDGDEKAIDKDGKVEPESFYYNMHFITGRSKWAPKIVNIYGDSITDESEIYGGCIVQAYFNFYGYDYMGKRGVSAGLQAVCKVEDGEPIGGGMVNTKEVFGNIIQPRPTVDFNSREYNEGPGQQGEEWGDKGDGPPIDNEDDSEIPF